MKRQNERGWPEINPIIIEFREKEKEKIGISGAGQHSLKSHYHWGEENEAETEMREKKVAI